MVAADLEVGRSILVHTHTDACACSWDVGCCSCFFWRTQPLFSKGRRRQIGIGRRPAAGGRGVPFSEPTPAVVNRLWALGLDWLAGQALGGWAATAKVGAPAPKITGRGPGNAMPSFFRVLRD